MPGERAAADVGPGARGAVDLDGAAVVRGTWAGPGRAGGEQCGSASIIKADKLNLDLGAVDVHDDLQIGCASTARG